MMEHIVLDLYHTCKNDKLAPNSDIVPFKARSNGKQWLGDGYYFWVESLFFAQSWGKTLTLTLAQVMQFCVIGLLFLEITYWIWLVHQQINKAF